MWHAGNVLHSLVKENELLTWREAKAGGKIWQPIVFSAILYLFSLKHSTKKLAGIYGIMTIVCLTRINHKTWIVKSGKVYLKFILHCKIFQGALEVLVSNTWFFHISSDKLGPLLWKRLSQVLLRVSPTVRSHHTQLMIRYYIKYLYYLEKLLQLRQFSDTPPAQLLIKFHQLEGKGEERKGRVLSGKAIFKKLFWE